MTFFELDCKSHVKPKDVSLAGRLFDRFDHELDLTQNAKPNIISFLRVNRLSFDPSFVGRNAIYQKERRVTRSVAVKTALNVISELSDFGKFVRESKRDSDGLV